MASSITKSSLYIGFVKVVLLNWFTAPDFEPFPAAGVGKIGFKYSVVQRRKASKERIS